jgi:hypothetical protein
MGFWACTLQGTINNAIDNAAFSTIFMVMRNLELRDMVGNEKDYDVHQVPAPLKQTSLRFGKDFGERINGDRSEKASRDVFYVGSSDFGR